MSSLQITTETFKLSLSSTHVLLWQSRCTLLQALSIAQVLNQSMVRNFLQLLAHMLESLEALMGCSIKLRLVCRLNSHAAFLSQLYHLLCKLKLGLSFVDGPEELLCPFTLLLDDFN
jgi:hypothetical protein